MTTDGGAPKLVEIHLRFRTDPGGQAALAIDAPGVHPEQVFYILNRAAAYLARTLTVQSVLLELQKGAGPQIVRPGDLPPLPPQGFPLR